MKQIPLSGKKGSGFFVMVDDDDFDMLSRYKWYLFGHSNVKYAMAIPPNGHGLKFGPRRKTIFMHRLILGLPEKDGKHVDHIDRNGLNCQRSNLRIATVSQNGHNRAVQKNSKTGIKGISFFMRKNGHGNKYNPVYEAGLTVSEKLVHKSRHRTLEAAIAARLNAERMYGHAGFTDNRVTDSERSLA